MIDLEDKYIDFIKHTIKSELKNFKLYIFGSRAKNNAKEYSDIDLAIDSPEFTEKVKMKLELVFENSTIPYEVDIINLNTISETFKNIIKDDLLEIS